MKICTFIVTKTSGPRLLLKRIGAPLMLGLLFLFLLIIGLPVFGKNETKKERLFVITRNKNDNMVCYDAQISNGKLNLKEPVVIYWIIPQKNNEVEDLTRMERKHAYGIDVKKTYGGDSADVVLKAAPVHLRIKKLNDHWVAIGKIDSVEAKFSAVYVKAEDSGMMPSVEWIRLTGTNVQTGAEVTEILKP